MNLCLLLLKRTFQGLNLLAQALIVSDFIPELANIRTITQRSTALTRCQDATTRSGPARVELTDRASLSGSVHIGPVRPTLRY